MSLGDDLIKVLCLGWGEGIQGKVIDDEQIRVKVFFDPLLPGVISPAGQKVTEQFCGLGEEGIVASSAGLMAEGLGDMAFARARGAVQEDMLSFLHKGARGQVSDKLTIDLGIKDKIELLQAFLLLEAGPREAKG